MKELKNAAIKLTLFIGGGLSMNLIHEEVVAYGLLCILSAAALIAVLSEKARRE